MSIRNMGPGGTAAPRAIAAGLLSLLAIACVRHLPVVGETEGKETAAHAGAGGRASASAGAPAVRRPASEQSAQRASAAGSGSEEEEASEPPEPSAGKSGSTPAASARAEAGASAQMEDKAGKADKAGAAAPEPSSAKAGSGAAPPSMPSTPGGSATPGTGWYCAQASNVCSCVEGSGVSGDTCTSHPTCCFEAASGTNGTMYRSCFCVADGSPECMAYTMTVAQGFKKASSCPL